MKKQYLTIIENMKTNNKENNKIEQVKEEFQSFLKYYFEINHIVDMDFSENNELVVQINKEMK